jgi:hypothetical protein
MADPELVKKWIQKADEDFGYASLSLKEEFTFFPLNMLALPTGRREIFEGLYCGL